MAFFVPNSTYSFEFLNDRRFDVISALPAELSIYIFQFLDPASMIAAMQVQRSWYWLYKSSKRLRRTLKRKVRERKAAKQFFMREFRVRSSNHCSHRLERKRKQSVFTSKYSRHEDIKCLRV